MAKFKDKRFRRIGVFIALVLYIWTFLLGEVLILPVAARYEGTVMSVRDNNTYYDVTLKVKDTVVFASFMDKPELNSVVTVYTTDGANYWDNTEKLVFIGNKTNHNPGAITLGATLKSVIKGMYWTISLTATAITILLIVTYIQRKLKLRQTSDTTMSKQIRRKVPKITK